MKSAVKESKTSKKKTIKKTIAKKVPVKKTVKAESVKESPIKETVVKAVPKKSTKVCRFRKITHGTHRHLDGKTYKYGDVLVDEPKNLSNIVKRHFKQLDKIVDDEDGGAVLIVKKLDNGKFNVVNSKTGNPINEAPLDKVTTESLTGYSIDD